MNCCENKNIRCNNYENICINCGVIHDYNNYNMYFIYKILEQGVQSFQNLRPKLLARFVKRVTRTGLQYKFVYPLTLDPY